MRQTHSLSSFNNQDTAILSLGESLATVARQSPIVKTSQTSWLRLENTEVEGHISFLPATMRGACKTLS